jgi:hypothetical protein
MLGVAIQEHIAPVVSQFLAFIDPGLWQFHQL